MLSDKKNTYCCFHTNTTEAAVPEKQTIDQTLFQRNQQKPLIVGLTWIYQIIKQTTLLKMEIH